MNKVAKNAAPATPLAQVPVAPAKPVAPVAAPVAPAPAIKQDEIVISKPVEAPKPVAKPVVKQRPSFLRFMAGHGLTMIGGMAATVGALVAAAGLAGAIPLAPAAIAAGAVVAGIAAMIGGQKVVDPELPLGKAALRGLTIGILG